MKLQEAVSVLREDVDLQARCVTPSYGPGFTTCTVHARLNHDYDISYAAVEFNITGEEGYSNPLIGDDQFNTALEYALHSGLWEIIG